MATADIQNALPSTCNIVVPKPDSDLHSIVSRWSDTYISLPYAVVTPTSTSDISATISFARTHNLKIIPKNGGHASFVPVDSRTIYLDLCRFKDISLDEVTGEVKIGGGCTAGDVLQGLKGKQWQTMVPNANAVGMIGALLGGLSHAQNGSKGFGIDHVRAITIIPFSSPTSEVPKEVTVTPDSTGAEKDLFNVICGAGFGFGVITSITMKAFPISELNLTEGKIWTRKLIFPGTEIETAAKLYARFLAPPPQFGSMFIFARAPPVAPNAGAPVIMINMSYFGPREEAEKVTAATFDEDVVGKAVVAATALIDWETVNDGAEPLNKHGGYKEYHGGFCRSVSLESMIESYKIWETFTGENVKERGGSYSVLGAWSPDQFMQNAGQQDGKFCQTRDRGIFVQHTPWYESKVDKEAADEYGKAATNLCRRADREEGLQDWALVSNALGEMGMEEIYSTEQIEKIRATKKVWDKNSLGWNPAVEGW